MITFNTVETGMGGIQFKEDLNFCISTRT